MSAKIGYYYYIKHCSMNSQDFLLKYQIKYVSIRLITLISTLVDINIINRDTGNLKGSDIIFIMIIVSGFLGKGKLEEEQMNTTGRRQDVNAV